MSHADRLRIVADTMTALRQFIDQAGDRLDLLAAELMKIRSEMPIELQVTDHAYDRQIPDADPWHIGMTIESSVIAQVPLTYADAPRAPFDPFPVDETGRPMLDEPIPYVSTGKAPA